MGKVFFCFPHRDVGGVPLLFMRLAGDLAARGYEVSLVDYRDGFMAARLPAGVGFLEYRDDGKAEIPPDALLVLQAMTPWSIFPGLRIPRSARLLFWNCHPFNLVPTLPGLRRAMQARPAFGRLILQTLLRAYRNFMVRFVTLLQSKRSLVFMDTPNVENTRRYLGLEISNPVLLPVPVAGRPGIPRPAPDFAGRGLRLAWIGRLVDFKFNILAHAIAELGRAQAALNVPIAMTVVGAGQYLNRLRRRAADTGNVAVTFIDQVAPEDLDEFLAARADILLAMGTSALEGAKLGIPTLLLDVAYRPVPAGYVFRWLDKSRGYSLGDVLSAEHIVPGSRSLEDRLREAMGDYRELSGRMLEYFGKNHALDAVADRFIMLAGSAACTWGDMADSGLAGRGAVYSAFDATRKGFARQ